jgi:hypothetical protein
MEPKLEGVYGVRGTWRQILEQVMDMRPGMPDVIKSSWEKNAQIARASGESLEPQRFSEMFVDANFID